MTQQPSTPSDEEQKQKALMKKIKIGILVAVVIVIVVVAVYVYFELQSKGDLYFIDCDWSDHHPLFGSPYATVEGTIFNSGSRTAGDVELIVRLYDSQDRLIHTEVIYIGSIFSKESKTFTYNIQYSGDAHGFEAAIGYKPYGP